MEANRIVYLGAKGKRNIFLSTKGENSAFLSNNFSGLTPKLLALVRPFAEKNIVDRISIPERPVKVPTIMLGTELRNISYDTPVLLIDKGLEFNTISQDPKTVGDVVNIMQQILFNTTAHSLADKGKIIYYGMDKDIISKRGVSVWLDEIQGETYNKTIGVFMRLTRFFGSVLDHAEVAIPLGMTVVDHKLN